jgi:ribonucleoside-diphosphate reductase alpha chain
MKNESYYGQITLSPERNEFFNEQSDSLIKKYYMVDSDENDPQRALARPALAFCGGDLDLAQRIYDYASKKWFMYASPVLSNASAPDAKSKGLPISCFLAKTSDTLKGLIAHTEETRWLSVKGGGVGGHWSEVRAISDIAPGPLPFLKTMDADVVAYKQGSTRKGSYAAYLDIGHPDIIGFINIRVPTGGDINAKCLNIHNAVNIPDVFMKKVMNNEMWELRCPHSGEVHDTVSARELWQRLLEIRYRTGEPYLNFIDTANRDLPQEMQDKGLKINGSNLCNEIHLPTSDQRTAVCCLSSVNLEKYEEWKDTQMVADLIRFLDNVLQHFIDNCPDEMARAKFSAQRERSLGLGAMGFHSLLQSKNIAWESPMARSWNKKIFKQIKEQAKEETVRLAEERGSCPDVIGVRNSHLLAVAPNANSGILCGTSASIEPIQANAYIHRTRVGSHLIKNKYLEKVLEEYDANTKDIWKVIEANHGSVQTLDFLSDHHKDVFKTSFELDQRWVVEHAADRQEFICQGQSVNLFFPEGADRAYVNKVHLDAFEKGLKGLYYLRTKAERKGENVNMKVERKALKDFDECIACQG